MLSATFDAKSSHEMFSSGLVFGTFPGQPQEPQQYLPPLSDEVTPVSLQPLPALEPLCQEQVFGFFGVDLSPPPIDLGDESSCLSSQEKLIVPNLSADESNLAPVDTKLSLPTSTTSLTFAPAPAVSSTASESGFSDHPNDSLSEAHQTIVDLEGTVEAMSLRIQQLENMLVQQKHEKATRAQKKMPRARQQTPSPSSDRRHSGASVVSTPPHNTSTGKMTLSLVGDMENQWYCDRPYPSIHFRVMDQATGLPVVSPPKFNVELSLLDGYGKVCDKLGGPAAAHGFEFESDKSGFVEVSNIRFTQVSSKMGGHFTLIVRAMSDEIDEYRSDRVTVLSYRLFNARKLDFNRLTTNDPLSKVKGIGSLYAKRFATLGINTVEHLSLLMTEKEESEGATGLFSCSQVIESLRKVRGALTCQKLEEYVLQAREVVKREQNNPQSTSAQSNKPKRNSRKRGHSSVSQTAALLALDMLPAAKPKRQCRVASDKVLDREHTQVEFVDLPF